MKKKTSYEVLADGVHTVPICDLADRLCSYRYLLRGQRTSVEVERPHEIRQLGGGGHGGGGVLREREDKMAGGQGEVPLLARRPPNGEVQAAQLLIIQAAAAVLALLLRNIQELKDRPRPPSCSSSKLLLLPSGPCF
jgi:hypothetical protein